MNLSIDFLFAALVAVVLIVMLMLYTVAYLKPPETVAIKSSLLLSRLMLNPAFTNCLKTIIKQYVETGHVNTNTVEYLKSIIAGYIDSRKYCISIYLHSCYIIISPRYGSSKLYRATVLQLPRTCNTSTGITSYASTIVYFYNSYIGKYEFCNVTVLFKVS